MDILRFLFGWLVPPPGASDIWVYVHRLVVAVLLFAILGMLREWNGGWLPRFEAFASTSQLADVKKQFDDRFNAVDKWKTDSDLALVKTQLQTAVTDACSAIEARDQRRLDSDNSNITVLADRYYDITKRGFDRPPCWNIVVDWKDKKASPTP